MIVNDGHLFKFAVNFQSLVAHGNIWLTMATFGCPLAQRLWVNFQGLVAHDNILLPFGLIYRDLDAYGSLARKTIKTSLE